MSRISKYLPKVDLHILEWAASYTPATVPRRFHAVAVVGDLFSLSTYACVASVKDGGCLRATSPSSPVPILDYIMSSLSTVTTGKYLQAGFHYIRILSAEPARTRR